MPPATKSTGPTEVGKFARKIERMVGKLDDLGCELDDLKQTLKELANGHHELQSAVRSAVRSAASRRVRELTARSVAMTMEFEWVDTQKAIVHIDGRVALLSRQLALLFECLKQASGVSPDSLLPFQTRDQVRRFFAKQAKPLSAHALENLVSRLRRKLAEEMGIHPAFVQTDERGIRLAAQRTPEPAFDPGL